MTRHTRRRTRTRTRPLSNSQWHVPSSHSFSLCRACHVTDHFRLLFVQAPFRPSITTSNSLSFARIRFHIRTPTVVPRLAAVARVHTNKPDARVGVRVHQTRVCALDLTRYTPGFLSVFPFPLRYCTLSARIRLDMRPRHFSAYAYIITISRSTCDCHRIKFFSLQCHVIEGSGIWLGSFVDARWCSFRVLCLVSFLLFLSDHCFMLSYHRWSCFQYVEC